MTECVWPSACVDTSEERVRTDNTILVILGKEAKLEK